MEKLFKNTLLECSILKRAKATAPIRVRVQETRSEVQQRDPHVRLREREGRRRPRAPPLLLTPKLRVLSCHSIGAGTAPFTAVRPRMDTLCT